MTRGTAGADELHGSDHAGDRIDGRGGDDRIWGAALRDLLRGGAGDDTLRGERQGDVLYGEAGDDALRGGGGDDDLTGGAGRDMIVGGAGNDLVRIASTAEANGDVVDGGSGYDFLDIDLRGSRTSFVLPAPRDGAIGFAGLTARNVEALIVHAGSGSDRIDAGDGNDSLVGGRGGDTLGGAGGGDRLFGEDGNDALSGGNGADLLVDGKGDDTLTGGNGADTLEAGSGADRLSGGAGDDLIRASADGGSADAYDGGAGLDTIVFGRGGDRAVRLDLLDQSRNGGGAAGDSFARIERFIAADANDTLGGSARAETFYGGGGRDALDGRGGNDVLSGGGGADTLTGGTGHDIFVIDPRDDRQSGDDEIADFRRGVDKLQVALDDFDFGNGETFTIVSGADPAAGGDAATFLFDTLTGRLSFARGAETSVVALLTGVDALSAADFIVVPAATPVSGDREPVYDGPWYLPNKYKFGVDSWWGDEWFGSEDELSDAAEDFTGVGGDYELFAYGGDDTLHVSGGDNRIYGGMGDDLIYGSDGWDDIDGGQDDYGFTADWGADTIHAGGGDDRVRIDSVDGAGDLLDGGDGIDELWIDLGDVSQGVVFVAPAPGAVVAYRGIVAENFEVFTVIGGLGADRIAGGESPFGDYFFGGGGDDTLQGFGGDDILKGEAGDDTVQGNAGNDLLQDDAGDDALSGGAGDDTLRGGEGRNRLEGGDGRDLLFSEGSGETLSGGSGDDTLCAYSGTGSVRYDGGSGIDTFSADIGQYVRAGWVYIDLADQSRNAGAAEGARFTGIEIFQGSEYDDEMHGGRRAETFRGGDADDVLDGGGGDDVLDGGNGSDRLIGGAGRDRFHLGLGRPLDEESTKLSPVQSLAADFDEIADFERGTDRIVIDAAAFGFAGIAPVIAAGHVARTAAPTFLFDAATHQLRFDADGKGSNAEAVLIGVLSGVDALSAVDFVFV